MTKDNINYGALIDEAMQIIVKKSLTYAVDHSLPGDHHFYISFLTRHKGVHLSEKLLSQYPKEMTIILQYQFDNLIVTDTGFSVTLSFNNIPEDIVVPFDALTAFADPSVKFGLQFRKFSEKVVDYHDGKQEQNLSNDKISSEAISDINNTPKKFSQSNIHNIETIGVKKLKLNTKKTAEITSSPSTKNTEKATTKSTTSNVVTLDNFRKEKKKNNPKTSN